MENITIRGFFLRFVVCTALCGLVKFLYPKVLVSFKEIILVTQELYKIKYPSVDLAERLFPASEDPYSNPVL